MKERIIPLFCLTVVCLVLGFVTGDRATAATRSGNYEDWPFVVMHFTAVLVALAVSTYLVYVVVIKGLSDE